MLPGLITITLRNMALIMQVKYDACSRDATVVAGDVPGGKMMGFSKSKHNFVVVILPSAAASSRMC